jgi:hypothetical protein
LTGQETGRQNVYDDMAHFSTSTGRKQVASAAHPAALTLRRRLFGTPVLRQRTSPSRRFDHFPRYLDAYEREQQRAGALAPHEYDAARDFWAAEIARAGGRG